MKGPMSEGITGQLATTDVQLTKAGLICGT
jgi:hypothetical protein